MPKINQEEYEILKNLDDKWKWIARDENGEVWVYKSKPIKLEKEWDSGVLTNLNNITFLQFIQWEDEEPHNITELIEEYEYKEFYDYIGWKYAESEETEVKDIEWLRDEVNELPIRFVGFSILKQREELTVSIDDVLELIDQLDEPEVKQLERKIRELESYNDELIRDNNQLRNAIDNQEVLSQEWIDEHSNGPSRSQYVWVDDLKEILVPKQEDMFNGEKPDEGEVYFAIGLGGAVEVNSASSIDEAVERLTEHDTNYSVSKKPVIPKFVAEAIEEDKECGYDVYESIDLIIGTNGGGLPSISDWVARNIDKYASAWLNGFTVEKEPLYRARLKVITDEFIASYLRTQSSDAEDRLKALEIGSKYIHEDYRHLSEFTEDELKRLDIWDSNQWEVEE